MQRAQWIFGTTLVGVSIAQSAIIAHKVEKIEPDPTKQVKLRQSLENARLITMLNGLGLAAMALRTKSSSKAMIPTGLLLAGVVLFPGIIFYEAQTKDMSYHSMVKFGGSASIFGWIAMGIL